MATPPVPQDFLQLSIKYEYFKRNTATQAHLNVCELVDRWPSKGPYEDFPKVELKSEVKSEENPDDPPKMAAPTAYRSTMFQEHESPPPKRVKMDDTIVLRKPEPSDFHFTEKDDLNPDDPTLNDSNADSPVRESTERDASDRDSDNYEMVPETQEHPNLNQNEQCSLTKIREIYDEQAGKELSELLESGKPTDLTGVMCMRRIAKTEYIHILQSIHKPVSLRTVNGYRKLRIIVGRGQSNENLTITYMSSEEGCLIWYGEELKVDKTIKYQSLAALDFFYLVRDKSLTFNDLEFLIEPYRKCDPAIWPFDSFYFKISRYIGDTKLRVLQLFVIVSNDRGRPANGKIILGTLFNLIKKYQVRVFSSLRIRVWDDSEVAKRRNIVPIEGELLNVICNTRLWKQMKHLDLAEPLIKILHPDSFECITHFDNIRCLGQDDFGLLLSAYEKIKKEEFTGGRVTCVHVTDAFDFEEADRHLTGRTNLKDVKIIEERIREFKFENRVFVSISKYEKKISFMS